MPRRAPKDADADLRVAFGDIHPRAPFVDDFHDRSPSITIEEGRWPRQAELGNKVESDARALKATFHESLRLSRNQAHKRALRHQRHNGRDAATTTRNSRVRRTSHPDKAPNAGVELDFSADPFPVPCH